MLELKAFRVKELTKMLGISKECIYKWIREGKFPPPRKIGGRVSIWLYEDIKQWIKKNNSTKSEEQNSKL